MAKIFVYLIIFFVAFCDAGAPQHFTFKKAEIERNTIPGKSGMSFGASIAYQIHDFWKLRKPGMSYQAAVKASQDIISNNTTDYDPVTDATRINYLQKIIAQQLALIMTDEFFMVPEIFTPTTETGLWNSQQTHMVFMGHNNNIDTINIRSNVDKKIRSSPLPESFKAYTNLSWNPRGTHLLIPVKKESDPTVYSFKILHIASTANESEEITTVPFDHKIDAIIWSPEKPFFILFSGNTFFKFSLQNPHKPEQLNFKDSIAAGTAIKPTEYMHAWSGNGNCFVFNAISREKEGTPSASTAIIYTDPNGRINIPPCLSSSWHPQDANILAHSVNPGTISLLDTQKLQDAKNLQAADKLAFTNPFGNFIYQTVCWHPQGTFLLVGGATAFFLINTKTGAHETLFPYQKRDNPFENLFIDAAAWNATGTLCVIGRYDGTYIYNHKKNITVKLSDQSYKLRWSQNNSLISTFHSGTISYTTSFVPPTKLTLEQLLLILGINHLYTIKDPVQFDAYKKELLASPALDTFINSKKLKDSLQIMKVQKGTVASAAPTTTATQQPPTTSAPAGMATTAAAAK